MKQKDVEAQWVAYGKQQVEREKINIQLKLLEQQAAPLRQMRAGITTKMQNIYIQIMSAESKTATKNSVATVIIKKKRKKKSKFRRKR